MPQRRRRPAHEDLPTHRPGIHLLANPHVAERLIRSCAPCPGDLVVEFGAGLGAITTPLARTGARVLAIERDAGFARRLRERVADEPGVRIRVDDARTTPLPREPFLVAASIPYAISSTLLRRLLTPASSRLRRAALIVEWGFAKRLTAEVPRTRELAWWAARFDLELVHRIPARHFRPVPSVDSAHLVARRRPGLGRGAQAALWTLLGAAYGAPRTPARRVVPRTGRGRHRLLAEHGIDPAQPAGDVPPPRWASLATTLASDRGLWFPPPPR
ncbi:23S rRNA (adenine-N6)-dimethyltransferase [Prauserella shujinwangii]|uniref:23S rRNA (Adenine-N6)-dimethyltransferase n=1 Tax=Prauserella shujinwangii TaxID=1453103 RepID=A0A2T0LZ73_9PSEU|nr:rRNA adenine N(6)-methyltransferase family protein [Prauserella shujinwangii]PRX49417.1 23S rRNA (adenine-N6)-dimethyltransferase [Prauserella shujinwangii]